MVETKPQQVTSGNGARAAGVPGERPIMMSVQHVTKHYKTGTGTVHALEDLSLEIPQGRVRLHPRSIRMRQEHAPLGHVRVCTT